MFREALASIQLVHIRFLCSEHSENIQKEILWCRGVLDSLLKEFQRPEVKLALKSKLDRKGRGLRLAEITSKPLEIR